MSGLTDMTDRELMLAKRAASRIPRRAQDDEAIGYCRRCDGAGQVVGGGTGLVGPESTGKGHAVWSPCPVCGGTGR